ncbi:MAG TPA: DUF3311 domain-containing protein [Rhizomicrobium sp.]
MSPFFRYTIGIAVPFLSVIPTVPLLNRLAIAPLGLPLGIWWLFAAIPLTSLCLAICWFGHDRHRPDEQIDTDYEGGPL